MANKKKNAIQEPTWRLSICLLDKEKLIRIEEAREVVFLLLYFSLAALSVSIAVTLMLQLQICLSKVYHSMCHNGPPPTPLISDGVRHQHQPEENINKIENRKKIG